MSEQNVIRRTEVDLDYCSYKQPASAGPDGKPLPKMTLDGVVVEFQPGDTIMQVAERVRVAADIPRFCYHPGMPIAGTCRMCTVEVEKAPKLMTSCSTPAADGMVVHTRSEKVLKSRTGVMEFLLTNHPLDCPVCDKAGECDLQDYNFEYGPHGSRFHEDKRVFTEATTKALSDKVTLNMNRCVHCERCVRFTEDVTKSYDLVMLNRGWHKELAVTDESKGLTSDYQGCLTDFCPVGALTFNDFRFQKRVWFLEKKPSVCDGCAKGCNVEVHSEKSVIHRLMPIFNEAVNGHWMCDPGRVSYHTHTDPSRLIAPMIPESGPMGVLHAASWETAASVAGAAIRNSSRPLALVATDCTNEEAGLLKERLPRLNAAFTVKSVNGTGVERADQNKPMDHLLIQSDKTPNTRGVEALGYAHVSAADISASDLVVVFRHGRAQVKLPSGTKAVLSGVFSREEVQAMTAAGVNVLAYLPGLGTPEKDGSYTNCDGRTQRFDVAVAHPGQGRSVAQTLALLGGK